MFRVFITNLGKYNEGKLVGKWLDLPCEDTEKNLLLSVYQTSRTRTACIMKNTL